ncbi:MAG: hypothetical protein M1812_004588 [Candelaria pacifica]|nr:MAG: hypothetical protein M1812_004588 [Candelaria pacifica]
MAQVSLLRQQLGPSRLDGDHEPGVELYSSCSASDEGSEAPLPNPPFVFPMRSSNSSPPTTSVPSWNAPAIYHSSQGTKDGSVTKRSSRRSGNTLPKFDFHPSASQDVDASRIPPHTPSPTTVSGSGTAPMTIPSRPGGHRRGVSEFIGGDGTNGLALVSTSPTKSESAPLPARLGPPAGRRGHAHRRSGAMSCHDLSTIIKPVDPNSLTRGGSAPTTPLDMDSDRAFPPFDEVEVSQRPANTASVDLNALPNNIGTTSGSGKDNKQPRARVGFSDTLEFIPRPLSTISSETSSSMATLRCSHSLSGSMSSLTSAGTASPPSARSGRLSLSTTFEQETSPTRPSTAGAVMAGTSDRQRICLGNDGNPLKRPMSVGGSPNTKSADVSFSFVSPPRKKHLFSPESCYGLSHNATSHVDKPGPFNEMMGCQLMEEYPSALVKPVFEVPTVSPLFTAAKKQKNVKTWAGSILSRKSRLRTFKQKKHGRRTLTPPLRSYTAPSISSRSSFDFSASSTCSVANPPTAYPPQPDLEPPLSLANQQRTLQDEDPAILSPLIDLDAALGPFNTPSPGLDIDSGFGTGFAAAKRRMHSSGTTGGFMGPGMHYHRRAESAPEMAAFDRGSLGLHRLGSNPTMADVFEEEEGEEDDEDGEVRLGQRDNERVEEDVGTGIQVVDADNLQEGKGMDWTTDTQFGFRKGSGIVGSNEANAGESSCETTVLVTSPVERTSISEAAFLEVVEENEAPRSSSITRSSDSSITPTLPPVAPEDKQRPPPLELGDPWLASPFALPRPASSTMSSAQPSPTYSRSTFESPQIATSASSFTDDYTYNSLLHGEPGPEIRMSVDDVPSLTSSNSTITSGVTSAGHSLSGGPYRTLGDRSASISSAVSGRPRQPTNSKRASLVSLSRLVGGSGSERSKLHIEQKPRPDSPEKPKERRGKRLSRMMNFLKPKKDSKSSKVSDASFPSESTS